MFTKIIFLIYYDKIRTLFVDLDASKKRDYKVIIYYINRNKKITKYNKLSRFNNIKSIVFLSKILFKIEARY